MNSDDATLNERVAELEQLVTRQAERIDHLEDELEDARAALGSQIAELNGRVYAVETDQVGAEDVIEAAPEDQLPIQQWVQVLKNGGSGLSANRGRAATVWPAFYDRARREGGKLKLDSEQVRSILKQADEPHDRNTTVRVMRMLARGTCADVDVADPDAEAEYNLVRFTKGHKAVLVADRDRWQSFFEEQVDSIQRQASEEFDMLDQAAVEVAHD